MSPSKKTNSTVIVIDRSMKDSAAFRDLSGAAIIVLFDFLGKRALSKPRNRKTSKWTIENNGKITYTYKEAESRGLATARFRRALDELIDHGFINVVETGAGIHKSATFYSISERYVHWDTDRFVDKPRLKRNRWRSDIGFQVGHKHYGSKTK